MKDKYIIVLFKNKLKKKIINKFITEKKAKEYFENLIKKSSEIKFCKKYENGSDSNFEIALLEKNSKEKKPVFIKDDMGRQVKIELKDDDYTIKKISYFCLEEHLLDYRTKKKITFNIFLNKFLNKDGLKLMSKLNNKIVLQNDDNYDVFTLKNVFDSDRLIDIVSQLLIDNKRVDVLIVKDYDTSQRKYLYKILEERGYPKKYLFRNSTTHLQ